jgi:hypothetical protein
MDVKYEISAGRQTVKDAVRGEYADLYWVHRNYANIV